jgi:hypothetical protein
MARGLFVGVLLLVAQREARAQCRVGIGSNEGRLLAFYTAPIVFSMATDPTPLPSASIRIGAEAEYIPKPDPTIEQTGTCFTQKSEQTSLSPVFGRPRITVGGPFGFSLEAAYLPPITIAKAKPNLFSFAVSRAYHFTRGPASNGTTLMFRVHGTFGNVKGAITCSESQLQQQSSADPCFGTRPSKDTFHPDMFGGEIAAGITPGVRGLSFYGGTGINRIDPHFQVGFTDLNGILDDSRVQLKTPAYRVAVFGGVTAVVKRVLDVGAQLYSVPTDATLFRLMGGIRIR